MSEIPAEHLPIIADRFRTFDDPRMSQDKLVELVHSYAHFLHMRTALEQMAEGAQSNADFASWPSGSSPTSARPDAGSRCRGG